MEERRELALRPYQEECIEKIEEKGAGRWLVAISVGLGKTVIFTHLPRQGRTLILSHRDELVRQPEKYFPEDVTFGVEKAGEKSDGEDVVSASVQSLSRDSRLTRFGPDEFDTIIIDEAHHSVSPSYMKILDHFSGARRRIGFTATPRRGDGVGLSGVFDEIVCEKSLKWGIENGYLSRIRCMNVQATYDLKGIRKLAGDYKPGELERRIKDSNAIVVAAKTYVEECHKKGRHTLIYGVTVNMCRDLLLTIRDLLPDAERKTVKMLSGDTPDDDRRDMLSGFMDGKVRCIVNCMVLTEGTDLPIADTIMNLRPTCNPSLFEQMVGRGSRLYPGKDYCLVIDVTPVDKTDGLCAAPTLFGVDPSALSGKQAEKFDADHDLLDECNRITGSVADIAEKISIEAAVHDLFVSRTEDMLTDAFRRGGGFTAIRQSFLDEKEKQGKPAGGIDFKGLLVDVGPDMAKRYTVKPSWNEEVHISDPDVLGNCAVSFSLLSDPRDPSSERKRYAGTLPADDAVSLARRFCEAYRGAFSYGWDAGLSGAWGAGPATEAQKARVLSDYRRYGATARDVARLKKGAASGLIDESTRLKDERRKRDLFKSAERGDGDARARAAALLTAGDGEDGAESLAAFSEAVGKAWRGKNAAAAAEDLPSGVSVTEDGDGTITVTATPEWFGAGPASAKQKGYVAALAGAAAERGYTFSDTATDGLTKKQAAALIPLLKVLCALPGREPAVKAGSLRGIALGAQEDASGRAVLVIKAETKEKEAE